MSNEPVRYAVVGLGRAGWGIHVHQLRGRPDAKIVAVVDPVEQRRGQASAEFNCRAYKDLGPMLSQADVEVVVIATPSVAHAAETKRALKSGKHVVVEKPMAMSVAEADSMIRAAADAKRHLFVHQNYRFYPEFIHLKEAVDSGILGRVYHVRNYMSTFARRNDWQTLAKNGGGVLNNTCPHFIDQILQLLPGTVTQVIGDLQQIASAGDVEDHVKAFIRTDAGATGDLEISSAQNVAIPLPKWIICGTHGTLTCDGTKSVIRYFDPAQVGPLDVVDGPAAERKYGNDDKLPWQERTIDVPPRPHGTFYDNVTGVLRRGDLMRIDPHSVREVIRVMALVRKGTAFNGKPRTARETRALVPSPAAPGEG